MAEAKKTTAKAAVKTAPAKEVKPVEVKAAEVKTEEKEAPKAEVKTEVKEAPKAAKKAPAKKAAKAPAKKTAAAKKETVKKTPDKKAEVSETVNFQFGGKSYTTDDLLKSCRDVWKYDLGGKEEDIKSIELYVKPEENTTYYVVNGDVTGSFFI